MIWRTIGTTEDVAVGNAPIVRVRGISKRLTKRDIANPLLLELRQ